ncbi:MAG TPA: sialidase family protein [Bacteroidales bacterium]|nr:sialidase family protein [Bacteroidales bacterium]
MMKKYILYIASCLLAISIDPGCKNNSDNNYIKKEYVLKLDTGIDNPRNSEGDFISLRDGRLLFVYSHYTGSSANDHANAYLAGRLSSDGGKTWTSEDVTIVEQEGIMNVMSVSLLRLQNREIALFYLRKNSDSDCIPMMRISADEGESWNDPVRCITDRDGYFVLNNCRVVQLENGRLLMPVSLHKSPGDTIFSRIGRIWCYNSDDMGRSWKVSAEVPNPESIVTQEPGLIELRNRDVMMYLRTMSGVQYFSYSEDKGETWSPVEPGNINSPCSPASIKRIPSTDDLLLVWNDNATDQKRTPFNIAYSEDEGKSWINKQIIENNPEGSYCYPAIYQTGKEILLSYFDWSTRGSVIIRVKKKDIYN